MTTALLFLVGFFLCCVLAFLRHPIFGLIAYLTTFYVHPPTRWWAYAIPDLRWALLAAGVTAVALLVRQKKQRGVPIRENKVFVWLILFIVWLCVQYLWALTPQMHYVLIDHYIKFAIAALLVLKCVDSELHLKYFLWAHLLGCFSFGLSAYLNYKGGRFEAYGGPGFADANFAGIQAVTAIFAASTLMLAGNKRERIAVCLVAPFIINALVTTASRSSFLALVAGGLVFIWLTPSKFRIGVSALAAVALVGFVSVSTPEYWERMGSILLAGEEVEGVDTGSGRLAEWDAQLQMFSKYPHGCGHRCTATLSPLYLEDRYLTGPPGNRARASHNTYLTLLVEQGIIGAGFAFIYTIWLSTTIFRLRRVLKHQSGILACALPGVAAILISISVVDVFVDYLKLEVRIWYMMILIVLGYFVTRRAEEAAIPSPAQRSDSTGTTVKAQRRNGRDFAGS